MPGIAASPQALARTLYSIAYQYYSHSLDLSGFVTDDLVFILLDRILNPESDKEPRLMARLHAQWSNYRMRKNGRDAGLGVLDLLKQETNRLICEDPELSMICRATAAAPTRTSISSGWVWSTGFQQGPLPFGR